tara:strand:+ start:547 stop:3354 length:2808 start_codon:yes stop_codon:yes gene_type:complete
MAKVPKQPLIVETLKHDDATRKNIPTAEYQSVMKKEQQSPVRVAYPREREGRNRDLDPQLVWRGKDEQDWSDLVVHAPPLYIQEKVHPKVLIDDLKRQTERAQGTDAPQVDMFADFNGLPNEDAKTEFYAHDAHWANRMILGDSLAVMASLAEREGLRGKVQCIYFDPPYGIKFNSNFQWSTTSRDVKDGNSGHITREPEQVKAFRDTWRDGIHSYLTYLRDRLTVARDLLTESGSIFVQIGDENVHRVKALLDEVFGEDNCVSMITVWKTSSQTSSQLASTSDYVVWYAKNKTLIKYRQLLTTKDPSDPQSGAADYKYLWLGNDRRKSFDSASEDERQNFKLFAPSPTTSQSGSETTRITIRFVGRNFDPGPGGWKTNADGFRRLIAADRLMSRSNSLRYVRFLDDYPVVPLANLWTDVRWGFDATQKIYVVQTNPRVVERCILMATDPGDLVLDPTCGSGTTAYVAEQWGRRWITIDTSRVALALARARIMGARYPYYLLADSREGQKKEAEVTRSVPSSSVVRGNVRHGFVYERVPHITLKSIANNAEIDVIYAQHQALLEPLREQIHKALGNAWEEWEIPIAANAEWPDAVKKIHADWWQQRIARQQAIDASIAAKAEFESLYDRPYEDKKKVRVAGPFTVESLSPHRVLGVDENDELIDPNDSKVADQQAEYNAARSFVQIILENLKTAGVQQAHKEDKIVFNSLVPWPGYLVCGEGIYEDSTGEKRAAIFIGPEFGTVSRPDLVSAAREAGDAGFDVLIACAFNYDAHSSEFEKLGRIPVLKARMNADLHMAEDLKNTGKGNLFVIFGEPDIDILDAAESQVRVKVNGVDVFHPNTGEVRSDGADGIACWFIDTDYNEESFFVRHAYFLGANDPYKALKTTLKAEINEDAWATLNSDTSRPFEKPKSGRIAVKVINHLGDEVMKVFKVS